MRRLWHIWMIFGLCLVVVFGAMGWVSLIAVRVERAEARARREAALEEKVRLALWRMDSALAPLIARESGRPYFAYRSFYPAQRGYTRMFAEARAGELLAPSPLLTEEPEHIFNYFQFEPDGKLTSPQVPGENVRLATKTGYTTPEKIEASAERLAALQALVSRRALMELLPPDEPRPASVRMPQVAVAGGQEQQVMDQDLANTLEWQARAQRSQQAAVPQKRNVKQSLSSIPDVHEGILRPLWVGSALVLARRVSVDGKDYVQGCWLDWEGINEWLLEGVRDLFPSADLEPVASKADEDGARMLAALPARFLPGAVPQAPAPWMSPIRLSLIIAWACMLVAVTAVGVLLRGAVSLSERRAAFVSAVTHELRTPLTTFRMYAEMLAEKMVPDEEKRRHYLNTLCDEADRLCHLVENVLAYAKIEGGRVPGHLQTVTLAELLSTAKGRLGHRTEQAGMRLIVAPDEEAASVAVRADMSAVEQILFNLVDNACKYAATASLRDVHLQASTTRDFGLLRVRDHGPGISSVVSHSDS